MTSEKLKSHAQRIWGGLQSLAIALALLFALANLLGFRLNDAVPGSRFAALERIDSVLKAADDSLRMQDRTLGMEVQGVRSTLKTMERLQCVGTSRRDAQLAGACEGLPTKDERRP